MASQFGQTSTGAGRTSVGQSTKAEAAQLGIVNFVFIETDDLVEKTPDIDKGFEEYTNASDYQLGAVIMQDKKPIAF